MNNVLRTLIFNDEVSLTIADTTEIVQEGIRLHNLTPASAYIYGRGMSALTRFPLTFISLFFKR